MSNILEHYSRMVAEAQSRATESWFRIDKLPDTGQSHERRKFHQAITPAIASKFRNYKIGGIGIEPSDYAVNHKVWEELPEFSLLDRGPIIRDEKLESRLEEIIRDAASSMTPEEIRIFFRAVDDSIDVGGAKYIIGLNKLLICSPFSYRMAQRAVRLFRVAKENEICPSVLLEIGGGHGRTFSDIYSSLGVKTGIYVDLPLNLLFSANYLSKIYKDKINLVWSEDIDIKVDMINLVVPWLLSSKLKFKVDFFVNFLSLQHMQAETQEFYLKELINNGMSWMYHENRLYPREPVEGSLAGSASLNAGRCVRSDAIFRPKMFGSAVDSAVDFTVYGQLVRFD